MKEEINEIRNKCIVVYEETNKIINKENESDLIFVHPEKGKIE